MSKPFGGGQNDTHHLKEQVDQVTQCRCKARLLGCEQWERTQSYPPPFQGSSEKRQTRLRWELQPWGPQLGGVRCA